MIRLIKLALQSVVFETYSWSVKKKQIVKTYTQYCTKITLCGVLAKARVPHSINVITGTNESRIVHAHYTGINSYPYSLFLYALFPPYCYHQYRIRAISTDNSLFWIQCFFIKGHGILSIHCVNRRWGWNLSQSGYFSMHILSECGMRILSQNGWFRGNASRRWRDGWKCASLLKCFHV